MSNTHEEINLVRQDIRTLEGEEKELQAELKRLKYSNVSNYHTQRQLVSDRLSTVAIELENKQTLLKRLLNRTQTNLFH